MAESYNPQGISDWLWFDAVADIASPAAPKVSELATGVSLGCSLMTPSAPVRQANTISATPLCADTERTLPALPTVTPASIELFRGDDGTSDASDLFDAMKDAERTTGWLVHVLHPTGTPAGGVTPPAVGDLVDVWPATINTVSVGSVAMGAPATWKIDFAHNGQFYENVAVVAS